MAKALSFRQLAKMFAKQSVIQARLAKLLMKVANDMNAALPADNVVTQDQLTAANSAFDNSVKATYISNGLSDQADAANAAADAAFAGGDQTEAP